MCEQCKVLREALERTAISLHTAFSHPTPFENCDVAFCPSNREALATAQEEE